MAIFSQPREFYFGDGGATGGASGGRVTVEIVQGEIQRLQSSWKTTELTRTDELDSILSDAVLNEIDLFDRSFERAGRSHFRPRPRLDLIGYLFEQRARVNVDARSSDLPRL